MHKVARNSSETSPLTAKILEHIEKAGESCFSDTFDPKFSEAPTRDLTKEACISLDEAMASGQFEHQGLGVYTCSGNAHVWRIEKDAAGNSVIVRDEEIAMQEDIVERMLQGEQS